MSIEAHHISKSFGGLKALDDVNLTVPHGELVAILGPSGSGKTTLLRVLAGLEQPDPDSGPVFFHQQDVAGHGVRDRRVGFVFQHYALFRHMTVFENIAFGLRVRPRANRPSRKTIRLRVLELLQLVQLEGMSQRNPAQLSGGQRQRVALARALAVEPRVLLLDEPFGALDAKVRQELRRWLRRLHDEIHLTSVFVTHDQDEALEVADRVVVMNRGGIEQVGTPDEVFHEPATEFVMSFIGHANRFAARVEQGELRFASITVAAPKLGLTTGGTARVFVRPHDFDLSPVQNGRPSVKASVVKAHSAGPTVRLELAAESGERFFVELPRESYRTLNISNDGVVFAVPRDFRVFGGGIDGR